MATRNHRLALGALVLGLVAYAALPLGDAARSVVYDAVAVAAMLVGFWGVHTNRPRQRRGWLLVLAGFTLWVVADIVWSVETYVVEVQTYPVPSDAVYLTGYVVVSVGLVVMIRAQRTTTELSNLLDVVIVATGCAVLVSAAVLVPVSGDSALTAAGKVVTSAYPIGDVLLLALASQLWSTPGLRSRSHVLLMASLVASFVPDVVWSALSYSAGTDVPGRLSDGLWLLVYLLAAAAACDRSMTVLAEPSRGQVRDITIRQRLSLLGIGLLLPSAALLLQEMSTGDGGVPVIGLGAFVMSLLTLVRMASLLEVVEGQAVQLAALANSDSLTGAPNRRIWDHELSSACRHSQRLGAPLCVALLDLDHFKAYNDRFGHQAGDRLLREAVAVWTQVLGNRGILARYGGEEFAVLLPRTTVDEATNTLFALRDVTPGGQTFSAGIALWDPETEPHIAMAHADRGLYLAKSAGRDRIIAFPSEHSQNGPQVPEVDMVLQPIVDLLSGEVLAHEALTRFGTRAPEAVFQLASDGGYRDVLEARAILAALAIPGRPALPLHVNVSAEALASERFWSLLPHDLDGIVMELHEQYDVQRLDDLQGAVDRLRKRGALLATDDLGHGTDEIARLARLRPDVVKVDRTIVEGCADDLGKQAVLGGAVAFCEMLGSRLCAEGARDVRDLQTLASLGVTELQCFLVARPAAGWAPAYVTVPLTASRPTSPAATQE